MSTVLASGSRVGIIGGGPAGSLCAHFLLLFAQRMDRDLQVDIFEPRDFSQPGPQGCNMCGGIVSESMIQALAVEGIPLPGRIVQRGLDSYMLHTSDRGVRVETPLQEKRIAAVHRGGGPRGAAVQRWGGLDGHLLALAQRHGARVVRARVRDGGWRNGRPMLHLDDVSHSYDLVVGATGVNSSPWPLFERLGLRTRAPVTARAYIMEILLGESQVDAQLGSCVHLFLLDIPRLDCAAIIPKGEFVTVCLLGEDIDGRVVGDFFASAAVRRCLPDLPEAAAAACECRPKINVREATRPYADRLVLVGDCGATRLYKDGIGAAYRTAKGAARTAVLQGVSAADFRAHYMPLYRALVGDNRYGRLIFRSLHQIKSMPLFLRGVLRMAAREQARAGAARDMSIVLWDTFTGSAPYRDIVLRALRPGFAARFLHAAVGADREAKP